MKRNMLRTALWATLAAAVAMGLSLVSCQAAEPESDPAVAANLPLETAAGIPHAEPSGPADHTHPIFVTWMTVEDFPRLVAASELVVRARVVDQRPVMKRVTPWNEERQRWMTAEEAGDVYTDLALTASTLIVEQVVRGGERAVAVGGQAVAAGSEIEIVELGGQQPDGCFAEPDDKPVLRPNEDAVFFLSPAGRPGAYNVVGGWQGRMNVREGKIYPLALHGHPGAKEFTRFEGIPVEQLIAEVGSEVPRK